MYLESRCSVAFERVAQGRRKLQRVWQAVTFYVSAVPARRFTACYAGSRRYWWVGSPSISVQSDVRLQSGGFPCKDGRRLGVRYRCGARIRPGNEVRALHLLALGYLFILAVGPRAAWCWRSIADHSTCDCATENRRSL